jgi:hypothetical protein
MSILQPIAKVITSIAIAYILAAPITNKISFDLRLTEWANIWTYIIWATSGAIWAVSIMVILTICGMIAVAMEIRR